MYRYILHVLLYIGYLSSVCVYAADGNTHDFELTWQETGFADTFKIELEENASFGIEPEFGPQRILRGTFDVGPEEKKESVGFIWVKSAGKLYVDLNRDGDLTNDPKGVLECVVEGA